MRYIIGDTPGVFYLCCFDEDIGNPENPRALAGHYGGWTLNLEERIAQHMAGQGAAIMRAVAERGIGFAVFAYHGTPNDERRLKRTWKNFRRLCPRCTRGRSPLKLHPINQLRFELPRGGTEENWELPEVPTAAPGRFDRFEAWVRNCWRAGHRVRVAETDYLDQPLEAWFR